MDESNKSNESNPYLAAISRKRRNIKKKLDKIYKIESKLENGGVLTDEQLEVLKTKASIEKSLGDIESLKNQIEEIANELALAEKENKEQAISVETNTYPLPDVTSNTTQVDIQIIDTSTQSEEYVVPSNKLNFEEKLISILSLLHVYSRYQSLTNQALPKHVDFFVKHLLGLTSISGYHETLEQSLKSLKLYLDEEEGANNELVHGISYFDMYKQIKLLSGHMDNTIDIVTNEPKIVIHQSAEPPSDSSVNPIIEDTVNEIANVTEESVEKSVIESNSESINRIDKQIVKNKSRKSKNEYKHTDKKIDSSVDIEKNGEIHKEVETKVNIPKKRTKRVKKTADKLPEGELDSNDTNVVEKLPEKTIETINEKVTEIMDEKVKENVHENVNTAIEVKGDRGSARGGRMGRGSRGIRSIGRGLNSGRGVSSGRGFNNRPSTANDAVNHNHANTPENLDKGINVSGGQGQGQGAGRGYHRRPKTTIGSTNNSVDKKPVSRSNDRELGKFGTWLGKSVDKPVETIKVPVLTKPNDIPKPQVSTKPNTAVNKPISVQPPVLVVPNNNIDSKVKSTDESKSKRLPFKPKPKVVEK